MRISLTREIQKLPFSPSDWLVMGVIGVVALGALAWVLTSLSLQFTAQVPARGGTYTEGIAGTPRFVNPVLAISDADRDLVSLVFAGLLKPTPDGQLLPDVASGYTVSDDKKTYTFTIRDGATFHDGTPLTADDVAFTISLAQNPAIKSPRRANWEGVQVSVISPTSIAFTLKEPYAPFLENASLGILPKHIWENVTPEEFPFSTLNINPVGAGPYQVTNMTPTAAGIPSEIELTAFEGAAHVPFITHMNFSFYPDSESLYTAVQRDPQLAAHSLPPTELNDSHRVNEAILGRVFSVFFNQNQNDIFANKKVRAALDEALDKKEIVSTLISGYGSPLRGPLPPETVAAPTEDEVSAEEHLAAAAAILESDGWVKGDDGVFVKTVKKVSQRLSFTLATGNAPELKGAAELVSNTWKALGADVTVQFFEQNDLQQEVIRPRKYDALLFGEVIGREMDLFAFWDSSQRNDPGLNVALYTNASVDALLGKARAATDTAERLAFTKEAAATIADEVAAVFLYSPHFLYLTPKNLSGMTLGTIATPADRFMTVTDWYVATERVWPLFQSK